MHLFTLSDLVHAATFGIQAALNLKDTIGATIWQLILLPIRHFSIAALIVAIAWLFFFWRNKGWALSGVFHLLRTKF